jgi:FdhD protein
MQTETKITRFEGDQSRTLADCVALEAPLEILLNGESLAVTMRTPGDDFALAAGFLYAESVIASRWDIATMGYLGQPGHPDWQNLLHVALSPELQVKGDVARLQRNFLATSACGVCGKASLQAAQCLAFPLPETDFVVTPAVLRALNAQLRAAQRAFDRTGGLHAAGLFDRAGTLLSIREDVGRHNALDKLVGNEVMNGRMPLDKNLLLVSGRASFEIMQKAAMARIPIVCAVSAPSSLAVSLAAELNITLIGFLRSDTFNVYSAPHRIQR